MREKRSRKTRWTDDRLQRLYARYNDRFWQGKLATYRALTGPRAEDDASTWIGLAIHSQRIVIVDVSQHASDKAIRKTLLHEMCHVAAGRRAGGIGGHGAAFFEHLERLLKRNALVAIGFPEAGGTLLSVTQIPSRFPLCQRALKRSIDEYQRWVENKCKGIEVHTVEDAEIIQNFEDAASVENLTWKRALLLIGRTYGLVDIDGNPLPFAEALLKRAKGRHQRGRRDWHEYQREPWHR